MFFADNKELLGYTQRQTFLAQGCQGQQMKDFHCQSLPCVCGPQCLRCPHRIFVFPLQVSISERVTYIQITCIIISIGLINMQMCSKKSFIWLCLCGMWSSEHMHSGVAAMQPQLLRGLWDLSSPTRIELVLPTFQGKFLTTEITREVGKSLNLQILGTCSKPTSLEQTG